MARHYSIKSFFREMPVALLARYFFKQGLLQEFDYSVLKGTKRDELFAAWLCLPNEERKRIEAEFQEIFAMSRDVAVRAIIDEAEWHMRNDPGKHAAFVEMFSALPNHFERAMIAFLDYKAFWKGATLLYHADTLPHWRKRKGFLHKQAAVDDASIRELETLTRDFFHRKEGRGNNCHVDCLRRGNRDYFFAYPEDYSKQSNEWVDGQFKPRPHNPAFEIVYIYAQQEGSLDINLRGDRKRMEPLQAIFASAILKMTDLPPDPKDMRVYNLDRLSQKEFVFSVDPGNGIQDVVVKMLRLSSRVKTGDRITVEANPDDDPDAVYDLLAQIGKSVPLHLYNVTQVDIMATVKMNVDSKVIRVPIRITHPNTCSLKYDEIGDKLRNMLEESGIEPKEPPKGIEI